jgi:hypothetical protein
VLIGQIVPVALRHRLFFAQANMRQSPLRGGVVSFRHS